MEQIKQLRQMRDEARARIEALPDHKLVTSLDALIADLEEAFGASEEEPSQPAIEIAAVEPAVEEEVVETNAAVLGADETSDQDEVAVEPAAESGEEAPADPVSIFDRGSDPDELGIGKKLNFGSNGANGGGANEGGETAEATPEDEEADAISKAIEELDADLAKTEFGR